MPAGNLPCIRKQYEKKESGSGSINQRCGSADPDPDRHQNVTYPQHGLPGLRGGFHLRIYDDKRAYLIYVFRVWTTWSMGERGSWPRRDSSPALPASSSHGLSSTPAFTHSQPLLQVQVTAWEGPGWTCLLISVDDTVPDPAFLVNVNTDTDRDPVADLSRIQRFDDS